MAKKKSKAATKAAKSKKPAKSKAKKPVKQIKKTVKKAVKKAAAPKKPAKKAVAKKKVEKSKKAVSRVVAKPKKAVKEIKKPVAAIQKKTRQPVVSKEKPKVVEEVGTSIPVVEKPPIPSPVFTRPKATYTPMKQMPDVKVIPKSSEPVDKTRYSDEELQEFKELILVKLEDARKELTNLQAALLNANDNGTDDTASTFKMLEDGSETLAKEEAGQLAVRQRKFVEQLENALTRIENKTYGICRVTGKLIPKERLRAVPHTTQSIEAKMQQYRD